jgi:hypothetical protein
MCRGTGVQVIELKALLDLLLMSLVKSTSISVDEGEETGLTKDF